MLWSIVSRAILTVVLLASGIVWQAPPVILSALFIGGSTIPLTLRALREYRKTQDHIAGELGDAFEARLQELEDRQDAGLNYVEELTDSRISDTTLRLAELEDRLEFAEQAIARFDDADPANDPNRLQVMRPV